MSAELVYQVEADYPVRRGGSWTWRRRYFSKAAALRMAERRRVGWLYPAQTWDDEDMVTEPATAVRVLVAPVGEWTTL